MKDILPLTRGLTLAGIESRLDGNGKLSAYMPPFMGTPQERQALAAYILEGLHAGKILPDPVFPAENKKPDLPPLIRTLTSTCCSAGIIWACTIFRIRIPIGCCCHRATISMPS